jgi:multidrug efflux system membrane fusion protein
MNIRPSNLLPGDSLEGFLPQVKARAFRGRMIVAGVLLLLGAALAWYFLAGSATPPETATPAPVHVAVAQQRNVTGFEHSLATVVALSTVQVTSLVTGQLLSAGFAEGQIVNKGQLLFQIDPRPFAATLAQARATLARDEANTISAEHDKVRFTTLAAEGAASAQQRDQAVATANADEATVQADKALIQTAELNLGYTKIVSPITGKTGPILIQPGNLVTANNTASPLVTITQLQPIKVSMFLPQSDLPRIEQQMAARRLQMVLNAAGGTPLAAAVDFVGNQVDPKTGTVELRATFDNRDLRLVPGQLVDAEVSLASFPDAIVVPRDAVNTGPESRYVFVVGGDNRAAMRAVNVLNDDGVNDAIQGVVRPGDRVVVEGQLRVTPGGPVQVLASAPRRASP